ncbi:conserved hypothetical protein [gamma proteobacterium NOR5-3]|nr:conserved hypothetical protein [gamma proteobacterium NOR5-3]
MTDWELHDFAVQVVKSQLSEEGKNVFSTQSSRKIDPSIWYEHEGDTYWVIVREARYPNNQPAMPPHVADIANELSKIGKAGFFASIVVANHNDSFDPNTKTPGSFLPLYRGHAMSVKYEGLVSIT